jgi:hypothetical protein
MPFDLPRGIVDRERLVIYLLLKLIYKMNSFSQEIKSFLGLLGSVHRLSPFRLLKSLVEIKISGFIGINSSRLFCHY